MKKIEKTVREDLFAMQDKGYREYRCKLMSTVGRVVFCNRAGISVRAHLGYLKDHRLSPWGHAKAIQKAVESRRRHSRKKQELRLLR